MYFLTGVTEHYGVPILDVDMVIGSLENALASTGGFCVGRSYVVGHQRLSGLGYCFSASLPPLLATAASEALRLIEVDPERVIKLQQYSKCIHKELQVAFKGSNFSLRGVDISPMKHIIYNGERNMMDQKLDELVNKLFEEASIMVTRARYLENEEQFSPTPSIRLMVQSELTNEEIERALLSITNIVHQLSA